mmetsp:Transcript_26378/g.70487  ORF Transcript_26378/g.70487 Transcript_26378/m.70487 type:complete len:191 (-) Transcript_26378:473-1045(-)
MAVEGGLLEDESAFMLRKFFRERREESGQSGRKEKREETLPRMGPLASLVSLPTSNLNLKNIVTPTFYDLRLLKAKTILTGAYSWAAISSFALLAPSAPLPIRLMTAVLALSSLCHWLTWPWRDESMEEHPVARIAFATDISCMGLIPALFTFQSLITVRMQPTAALLIVSILALCHMGAVRARFNESRG